MIEETIKRFGRIDILTNNAEIAEKPTTKKTTPTTINEITATTSNATNSFNEQISPYFTLEEYEIADLYLKGIYLCIREAVKRMVIGGANEKEKNENDNNNNNIEEGRVFTQLSIYPLPINQYQSLKQMNILSQYQE